MAEKLRKGDYVEVTNSNAPDDRIGRKGVVAVEADDDGDVKVLYDGERDTEYAHEGWLTLRRIAPSQAEIDDAVQTLKMAGTFEFSQRAKEWEVKHFGAAKVKRSEVEVGDDDTTFYLSLDQAIAIGERAKEARDFDGDTPRTIYGGVA